MCHPVPTAVSTGAHCAPPAPPGPRTPPPAAQVLTLHSLTPPLEQEQVLEPIPPGHCRFVLATDVAESSLTLPGVRYVLDSGLRRGLYTDPRTGQPAVVGRWVSQAAAKHRAGRAGRGGPGTVLRLYTRAFHKACLPQYDDPEIAHAALERPLLSAKRLFADNEYAEDVLKRLPTPPSPHRLDYYQQQLLQYGAMAGAEVTRIGGLALGLGLELPLARLVLLGHEMGWLLESVVVAACAEQGAWRAWRRGGGEAGGRAPTVAATALCCGSVVGPSSPVLWPSPRAVCCAVPVRSGGTHIPPTPPLRPPKQPGTVRANAAGRYVLLVLLQHVQETCRSLG